LGSFCRIQTAVTKEHLLPVNLTVQFACAQIRCCLVTQMTGLRGPSAPNQIDASIRIGANASIGGRGNAGLPTDTSPKLRLPQNSWLA
jgi:hypothetical protein